VDEQQEEKNDYQQDKKYYASALLQDAVGKQFFCHHLNVS
jgi:hypothetical protein